MEKRESRKDSRARQSSFSYPGWHAGAPEEMFPMREEVQASGASSELLEALTSRLALRPMPQGHLIKINFNPLCLVRKWGIRCPCGFTGACLDSAEVERVADNHLRIAEEVAKNAR
jgi:hypothetical protein